MLIYLHGARLLTAYVSYTFIQYNHQNIIKQTKVMFFLWFTFDTGAFYSFTPSRQTNIL